MVISTSWAALANLADAAVDSTFGERVRFIPWSDGGGYQTAGPDNSRAPSPVVLACFVNPAASTSDTSAGTRITSDLKLSIRQSLVPAKLRKGDRVDFLDRDDWTLQVSFIEPGPTGRYVIHLLRTTESELT